MPIISQFFGIKIYMQFEEDIQKHKKPHIHVIYGEYAASVALDGELLAGSMPRKQFKLIDAWIALHEEELYQNWILAVRREELIRIEPLR